jgi:hypothetical protein
MVLKNINICILSKGILFYVIFYLEVLLLPLKQNPTPRPINRPVGTLFTKKPMPIPVSKPAGIKSPLESFDL